MSIIRIFIALVQAILKTFVTAFLAMVSLGLVWMLGILALVGVILVAIFGVGGLHQIIKHRRSR